jgi:hypothetical protein
MPRAKHTATQRGNAQQSRQRRASARGTASARVGGREAGTGRWTAEQTHRARSHQRWGQQGEQRSTARGVGRKAEGRREERGGESGAFLVLVDGFAFEVHVDFHLRERQRARASTPSSERRAASSALWPRGVHARETLHCETQHDPPSDMTSSTVSQLDDEGDGERGREYLGGCEAGKK